MCVTRHFVVCSFALSPLGVQTFVSSGATPTYVRFDPHDIFVLLFRKVKTNLLATSRSRDGAQIVEKTSLRFRLKFCDNPITYN